MGPVGFPFPLEIPFPWSSLVSRHLLSRFLYVLDVAIDVANNRRSNNDSNVCDATGIEHKTRNSRLHKKTILRCWKLAYQVLTRF